MLSFGAADAKTASRCVAAAYCARDSGECVIFCGKHDKCFLHLQEVDYERKAEKEKKKTRKEQLRKLGKKERKHQRALDALEKELSVADARETREQRIKVVKCPCA